MDHISGEHVDRVKIRGFVTTQQGATGIRGGELFGGRTIDWFALGDEWTERARNYLRSWVDPEYEKIVQEEFFIYLQETVSTEAKEIRSDPWELTTTNTKG